MQYERLATLILLGDPWKRLPLPSSCAPLACDLPLATRRKGLAAAFDTRPQMACSIYVNIRFQATLYRNALTSVRVNMHPYSRGGLRATYIDDGWAGSSAVPKLTLKTAKTDSQSKSRIRHSTANDSGCKHFWSLTQASHDASSQMKDIQIHCHWIDLEKGFLIKSQILGNPAGGSLSMAPLIHPSLDLHRNDTPPEAKVFIKLYGFKIVDWVSIKTFMDRDPTQFSQSRPPAVLFVFLISRCGHRAAAVRQFLSSNSNIALLQTAGNATWLISDNKIGRMKGSRIISMLPSDIFHKDVSQTFISATFKHSQ